MEDCLELSECGAFFRRVAFRYEPETWVTL